MNTIVQMNCGPECPGCQEGGCVIAEDTFTRANNSDINDGAPFEWEGDTTGMTIRSNFLQIPAGTTYFLTCPKARAASRHSAFVRASFPYFYNYASSVIEVWIGADIDNRVIARVVRDIVANNRAMMQIVKVTAGVEEVLDSILTNDTSVYERYLILYYDHADGRLYAKYPDNLGIPTFPSIHVEICVDLDELPGLYSGMSGYVSPDLPSTFNWARWFSYEKIRSDDEDSPDFYCEERVCPTPPRPCAEVILDCCDDWPNLFGVELANWITAHPMELLIPSGTLTALGCNLARCQTIENVPLALVGSLVGSGAGPYFYQWVWPGPTEGTPYYLSGGCDASYYQIWAVVTIQCSNVTIAGGSGPDWACRKLLRFSMVAPGAIYQAEQVGTIGDCFLSPTNFVTATTPWGVGACEIPLGSTIIFRPSP